MIRRCRTRAARAASLALLVLAAGCQDTTAPPPELDTAVLPETVVVVDQTPGSTAEGAQRPPTPVILPRSQWSEAEMAADSLGRIGVAAVPELLTVLGDENEPMELRRQAAEILAHIGPPATELPGTIPALEAALASDDEGLRKAAARALGQMGPSAAAAVPELMQILREQAQEAQKDNPPDTTLPENPAD